MNTIFISSITNNMSGRASPFFATREDAIADCDIRNARAQALGVDARYSPCALLLTSLNSDDLIVANNVIRKAGA